MTAALATTRLRDVIAQDRRDRATAAQHARELAARDQRIAVLQAAHEVTRPGTARKLARDWGSGNRIVGLDAKQLRDQARHLVRDLDIARNALGVLVQNTCGSGIDVLAAPRLPGQPIDRALARDLDDLWDDWWDLPEATKAHDYGAAQQLMAASWFRDGEVFYQDLTGPVDAYLHGTVVPYSFEMLEADMVPLDATDPAQRILQGVQRNAWGQAIAYRVYKQHPGDAYGTLNYDTSTKSVPAAVLKHVALIDRIHQVRGLSVFASSMSRFEDVKDYEESERLAAKLAASMSAYIKKGDPAQYGSSNLSGSLMVPEGAAGTPRQMRMFPGAVFDDLLPGEEIGVIDSKRPNPNAAIWRKEQLRAAAGGIGVSYSSLSLDYNGTYSAQRQELVEKWGAYQMLAEQFIAQTVRRQRVAWMQAVLLAGLVKVPKGWKFRHLAAATYVRPMMPWIDPLKEAYARGEAEDRGWTSPQQNALAYGNNPEESLTQASDWRRRREQLGLPVDSAPESDAQASGALKHAVVAHALMETT